MEAAQQAIGAGGLHSCALESDGTPVCWGNDEKGQSSPPADTTLTSITTGGSYTCGLKADGSPICWGENDRGQASPPLGKTFVSVRMGVTQLPQTSQLQALQLVWLT